MDDRIEVDGCEHEDEKSDDGSEPGDAAKKGWEVAELRKENRPGEEDDQGPYVQHLRKVDGGDVVVFIAEDNSSIPNDKGGKADEKRYLRP